MIVSAIAAVLLLAAVPGSAFAHECFNASRSAQGNVGADNSPRWLTLQISEFFTDPELGLSPSEQATALALLAQAQANGEVPNDVTIYIGNHTIAEDTPSMDRNGHAADGSGIDHFFDAYGAQLFGILCTAAPSNPQCAG